RAPVSGQQRICARCHGHVDVNTSQYSTIACARGRRYWAAHGGSEQGRTGEEDAFMSSARALLRSVPDPAVDYAAAEAKFPALQDLDGKDVRGECCSTLLTHGARMPRVYVLLHGLSNCPRQFVKFAPLLFARGANVLAPRMPFHGG